MKTIRTWFDHISDRQKLFAAYIFLILYITVLSRSPGERITCGLFWEWENHMWKDILQNILLFIPFGYLGGKKRVILQGLLLSICIETLQYQYALGFCEVDDVLHNTFGSAIGLGIWEVTAMMRLKKWTELPQNMQCREVEPYYRILKRKEGSLAIKRTFDICAGIVLLIFLALPMVVIAGMIKLDSPGPVFYRQERVTQYGRIFRIHKFRTMVTGADRMGSSITVSNDSRVTKLGGTLRKFRLDELPQLIDVLIGDMSFVGTRPEAPKYVAKYKPEYYATLLLPAGITSRASICYRNEAELLSSVSDVDKTYIENILPGKMTYNLMDLRHFSLLKDLATMFLTVAAVLK